MEDQQEVIYTAAGVTQAHILAQALEDEGIEAYVANDALQIAGGDLPVATAAAPQIRVRSRDAERARKLVREFDEAERRRLADESALRPSQFGLRALFYLTAVVAIYLFINRLLAGTPVEDLGPELAFEALILTVLYIGYRRARSRREAPRAVATGELADLEEVEPADEVADWPECPQCGRRRLATCPVCETAGTDFPAAFMPASGDEGPRSPRLVCPICDEVFRPLYPIACEWCGHRFAEGRELPEPAEWTSPFAEVNARVWIVIALLAISFMALAGLVLYNLPER